MKVFKKEILNRTVSNNMEDTSELVTWCTSFLVSFLEHITTGGKTSYLYY